MAVHKQQRTFIATLQAAGVTVDAVRLNGRGHIEAQVTYNGHRTRFVAPATPSDWRGVRNKAAEVRRWIRSCAPAPSTGAGAAPVR